MTDDQESSEDKLSRLKHKLKDMGVMQDENVRLEHKRKPFWRGKLPILLVLFFAIAFISWISRNDLTSHKLDVQNKPVSNDNSVSVQTPLYPSYENYHANRFYPPPPPVWNRAPLYNSNHQSHQRRGFAARPNGPQSPNRYYGRYSPPPGWQPYRAYPPPPIYYDRSYHYRPPPGLYSNPGYRGYNSQSRPPNRPYFSVAK